MKKLIILIFLIGFATTVKSQIDPGLLVNISSATSAEMLNITTETEGSMVFNSDEKRLYQFNGTVWLRLTVEGYPVIEEKTVGYEITTLDAGKVFVFDSAVDVRLHIPTDLPIGFNISFYQIGEGQVNITADIDVSLNNRLSRFKTAGKEAGAGLICTAKNTFHLTGDLKK